MYIALTNRSSNFLEKKLFGDIFTCSPIWHDFLLLIALVTILDLQVHHLDIQTTLLHDDLQEEIYMLKPPRFESRSQPNYVC